jgi:hypothetical protein
MSGSVSRIRRRQRHPSAGAAKPISRSHVGRHQAGQRVAVESVDGLLHVTHDGVLVATHARRHLPEDDERMDRRAKASRPARPTRATRSFARSTRQARPASLGPATASVTGTSDRSSGFAWSPTPFRSPRTAVCFARTTPTTTRPRSSEPWPTPVADQGGAFRVSHRYRSHFETRVPRPHTSRNAFLRREAIVHKRRLRT